MANVMPAGVARLSGQQVRVPQVHSSIAPGMVPAFAGYPLRYVDAGGTPSNTLIRAQGGLACAPPPLDGTACQWPPGRAEYRRPAPSPHRTCAVSRLHHLIHRHQLVGVMVDLPLREVRSTSCPTPGLRLRGLGQQQLVADRGDEIDLDVHLILGAHALPPFAQASLPVGTQ